MPEEYIYTGAVSPERREEALECYNAYKSDRASLISRIKDNEAYYRSFYEKRVPDLLKKMQCSTPLLFSCIENTAADAAGSYPVPNILERSPEGTEAADALSRLLPVQLEMSKFRQVYNANILNKLKYGTAIYGVFYNGVKNDIDIRAVDLQDIYVDMHMENIQDSKYLFISAAVDNELLKKQYPKLGRLFCGDAAVEAIAGGYTLRNRSEVLDCYYKKPDGTLHMMKLCKGIIIEATEDMDGYENGLYDHGSFPVVFDTLYPVKNCPFGFGMIDMGKQTQIEIDKLDEAITRNAMVTSKPRYFAKANSGVNESEFADLSRDIVRCEGSIEQNIAAIQCAQMGANPITHREYKKAELKELLANRDFQQGQTMGGVTAASAIETLRTAGEKRSRKLINDTYDCYKEIIYMTIELIRQFYNDERVFRVGDSVGNKSFIRFSSDMLRSEGGYNALTGERENRPIEFDIEVVPQTENPNTQEAQNNTLMTLWNNGFFLPQNMQLSQLVLKGMDFKGKTQLLNDMQDFLSNNSQAAPPTEAAMPAAAGQAEAENGDKLIGIPINKGAENEI